ncbi:MAG: polysaccharide lyase 6 family protein, partial [Myxococcota bacterium]
MRACSLTVCLLAAACGDAATSGLDPRTTIRSTNDNVGEAGSANTNANQNAGGSNNNNASNANINTSQNDNTNANANQNTNDNQQIPEPDPCIDAPTALEDAIDSALPGDTVTLCAGVWDGLTLTVRSSGSEDAPVRIVGEDGVRVTGESEIRIEGDYVSLAYLRFENGEPLGDNGAVRIFGDHVSFTDSVIDGYNGVGKKWLSLEAGSTFGEVAYNRFANKDTKGALLTVWRSNSSAQDHWIHHNHFVDYADGGGENGWETIRIGTSDQSQSDSRTTVEANLFERCDGEIEIISVKSGANVLRGNTFLESAGLLTLRHGKGNRVEDNVFLTGEVDGGGGIRIYDSDHMIRNNYIEGVRTGSNSRGGIVLHSGNNLEGGPDTALNGQWTPYRVEIVANTVIDAQQSFVYGGRQSFPAREPVFRDNLVFNDAAFTVVREDGTLVTPSYASEQYWGSSLGISSRSGITFAAVDDLRTENGLRLSPSRGATGLVPLSVS